MTEKRTEEKQEKVKVKMKMRQLRQRCTAPFNDGRGSKINHFLQNVRYTMIYTCPMCPIGPTSGPTASDPPKFAKVIFQFNSVGSTSRVPGTIPPKEEGSLKLMLPSLLDDDALAFCRVSSLCHIVPKSEI